LKWALLTEEFSLNGSRSPDFFTDQINLVGKSKMAVVIGSIPNLNLSGVAVNTGLKTKSLLLVYKDEFYIFEIEE
jgi:hypothetical protein